MNKCPIPLFPYYGVARADAEILPSLILNLANRGPSVSRHNRSFYAIDGPNLSLYYAYPVAYGPAEFKNLNSGEIVGWNGARRDSGLTPGPAVVDLDFGTVVVPFYLYQMTVPNISPVRKTVFWEAH